MLIRPRAFTRDLASSGSPLTVSVENLAALKALRPRPDVVIVKTGQAAGTWQWVAGDSTTADDALVVECTSGTAGRYKRVLEDPASVVAAFWGAKNDGTDATTTTAAINAAIVYVASLGGGTVKLGAGTYLVEHSGTDVMVYDGVDTDVLYAIKLLSGVTLEGISDEATEIKLAPEQDATAMVKVAVDAVGCRVRRLKLNGDKDEQNFSGSLMGIRGANGNDNCTYEDITLENFCGRALETNGDGALSDTLDNPATVITIRSVKCRGNLTKNIHIRRTDGAHVSGCDIITEAIPDNGGTPPPGTIPNSDNASAYEASGSFNWVFDDNDVEHLTENWGVGGRVVNGAANGVISKLRAKGGRQGIHIADADHVKVLGCRLEENGSSGIVIQCIGQAATTSRDILIDGNTIINPVGYAISVGVVAPGTDLLDVKIVNNYCYDDGANVMTHGLRNNATGTITAYEAGNTVRNAQTAAFTGTFLPLNQTSGTWSPEISFSTSNGDLAVTYAAQSGTWWRIGNLVIGKIVIQTSAFTHTTATGDLRISGPALTVKNDTNARGMGFGSARGITKTNFTEFALVAVQNLTSFGMQASGSGQVSTNVTAGDLPSGGTVRFEMMFIYETSSVMTTP